MTEMDSLTDLWIKNYIHFLFILILLLEGTEGLAHVNDSMKFEPDVYDDIQTVESEFPRIPHIIHFVFVTYETDEPNIPEFYKSNAASFVHFNPDWTFTLWTMKLGRQLIAAKHPDLLSTWDNYIDEIKKADALRYVLLYEFGGVYTDLDTICRRNLDRATMKYACILTPEPFEHSALLYRYPFMICNGYMMCRPNHPLMKQAIASLKYSASEDTVLDIAGPLFLTRQFKQYNNIQPADSNRTKLYNESNSPYFYKGWRREDDFNGVYIANTHYFMRYVDPTIKFYDLCKEPLSQLAKRAVLSGTIIKTEVTRFLIPIIFGVICILYTQK